MKSAEASSLSTSFPSASPVNPHGRTQTWVIHKYHYQVVLNDLHSVHSPLSIDYYDQFNPIIINFIDHRQTLSQP